MKIKTALIPLVLCAVGMTFTACGDKKINSGSNGSTQTSSKTTTSVTTTGSTSGSTTRSDSNESGKNNNARSADVDGDGFIEDMVTDISDAARDIVDDIIPGDNGNNKR